MERRDVLVMAAAATAAFGSSTGLASAQHEAAGTDGGAAAGRRQTGRVDLIISGARGAPLSDGQRIIERARATQFYDAGRHSPELKSGGVDYVPAVFPDNALAVALIDGLLVNKFTVAGAVPPPWDALGSGTYYTYIDFVEGPDYDSGRWVTRIVDDAGKVRRVISGGEVRQVVDLHVDDALREEHSRPSIHVHGMMKREDAFQFGEEYLASSSWTVTSGDWVAAGSGCARVQTCTPVM